MTAQASLRGIAAPPPPLYRPRSWRLGNPRAGVSAVPAGARQGLFSKPLCSDPAVGRSQAVGAAGVPGALHSARLLPTWAGPLAPLAPENPGRSVTPRTQLHFVFMGLGSQKTPLYFFFKVILKKPHFRCKDPKRPLSTGAERFRILRSPKPPCLPPLLPGAIVALRPGSTLPALEASSGGVKSFGFSSSAFP